MTTGFCPCVNLDQTFPWEGKGAPFPPSVKWLSIGRWYFPKMTITIFPHACQEHCYSPLPRKAVYLTSPGTWPGLVTDSEQDVTEVTLYDFQGWVRKNNTASLSWETSCHVVRKPRPHREGRCKWSGQQPN